MTYLVGFGLWELYFFVFVGLPLNFFCIILSLLKKSVGWQNMIVRICTIINIVTILVLMLWIMLNGLTRTDRYSIISVLVIVGITAFFLYRLRKKRLAEVDL